MNVIKNLAFVNKNRLKTLTSFMEAEISLFSFPYFPFDFLHSFLPFRCKFLTESFVSIKNKKINGLISVIKTGFKKVKITRLLLEENSSMEGKLLVNYITTLYSSKGAETFYIIVNKENTRLLTMLKDGCGFRAKGCEIIYKIEKENFNLKHEAANFDFIRKSKIKDFRALEELNENTLKSYQKVNFLKTAKDYRASMLGGVNLFVVENEKKIIAYFSILKLKKGEFLLDFMIIPSYEGYLEVIIKYAKMHLLSDKNLKCLYVKLKNYYSNYESLKQILDMEYKNSYENEVLIKDFMITAVQSYSYEKMIFNDITPAF